MVTRSRSITTAPAARTSDGGRSPSPPTARVVQVVELLAEHPTEAFSLAEIARSLDMNKATCLSILTQLDQAGWVIRDPRTKTFTLGGSFATLGRAAEAAFPALRHARIALDRLCTERAVPGIISAPQGHSIVVLEAIGDPIGPRSEGPASQRIPFVPPFGVTFLAWAPPEKVEAWYQRSDVPVTAEDREWYARVFASVRARGYAAARLTESTVRIRQLLADVRHDPLARQIETTIRRLIHELDIRSELVDELLPGHRFPVNVMNVPVFDAAAQPVLQLTLHLMRDEMAFEELEPLATRAVAEAREVTRASGGRLPEGVDDAR